MMKLYALTVAAVVLLAVTACSSTNHSEYVWVTDYDQIQLVEGVNRKNSLTTQVYWVNPPMKRIHRSELDKYRQQHQQP